MMDRHRTQGSAEAVDIARNVHDALRFRLHSLGQWRAIGDKASSLAPLVSILALAIGIALGSASDRLSSIVNSAASGFIDGYGYGAPVLIFVVLAPVLSRIFSTRQEGKFGIYVISWLAASKILAMLWAVVFTVAIFRLPVISDQSLSVGDTFLQTFRTLLSTLTKSQFFWAIYVAIATGFVAVRVKPMAKVLEKGVTAVEYAGQYIQPLIPLFMFAVGVYIQSLPSQLEGQIGLEGNITSFQTVNILGLSMDPNTTSGMVMVYVVGALLVGIACTVWHAGILGLAKYRDSRFSLRDYFTKYWIVGRQRK